MSIFEKPKEALDKSYFFQLVSIMVYFLKKGEKKCEHTFFDFLPFFGHFLILSKYNNEMATKNNAKICSRFFCEKCDYKTNKKSSYDIHILSIKHNATTQNLPTCKKYICTICSKAFNDRAGLWRHEKMPCEPQESSSETTNHHNEPPDFTMKLIEQNQELIKQLVELSKNQTNNITNNTNNSNNSNNSNNNTSFNLNFYLNDTCKDALNMNEFVDSLVLNLNDLEETVRVGYANGISKIFINGLKKLDVCKRPLHCSDAKRSTLYVKNADQWIKETDEKPILTKAIKQVANKNIQNIFEWQKKNPEYRDPESKQNDRYNKLICETMSGSTTEEQLKNYEKIVSNVVKEVSIVKL